MVNCMRGFGEFVAKNVLPQKKTQKTFSPYNFPSGISAAENEWKMKSSILFCPYGSGGVPSKYLIRSYGDDVTVYG